MPRTRAQCGTRSKYQAGCHCEPCTDANRVYARLRWRKYYRPRQRRVIDMSDAAQIGRALFYLSHG